MTVIDTSFLAAWTRRGDHFHAEARKKPLFRSRLLIPWEVWTEFCQVLMRGPTTADRRRIVGIIRRGPFQVRHVTSSDEIDWILTNADRIQGTLARLGSKPLSFVDFIVCVLAGRLQESVLTFDESMQIAIRHEIFPGARLA